MPRPLSPLLALLAAGCATPAVADDDLATTLRRLTAGFRGDVGYYVRHLDTGETAAHRADELFPTASMIKVPIVAALLQRVEDGELDYHEELDWSTERVYPGEDLLASFADGETVGLDKVAMLAITTSDNTAALWCQELAGTGTAVNAFLDANGFRATRVNSRTPGRHDDWERLGWGQTTPREMAELVVRIREGALISPAASEELYRLLSRIYWDDQALSRLPPRVHTASKQGAVSRSRSEVVLVEAPSGPFVFCVITNDQEDTRWDRDNEGFALLRRFAAAVWHHFEPDHPYTPPPGMPRYW